MLENTAEQTDRRERQKRVCGYLLELLSFSSTTEFYLHSGEKKLHFGTCRTELAKRLGSFQAHVKCYKILIKILFSTGEQRRVFQIIRASDLTEGINYQ